MGWGPGTPAAPKIKARYPRGYFTSLSHLFHMPSGACGTMNCNPPPPPPPGHTNTSLRVELLTKHVIRHLSRQKHEEQVMLGCLQTKTSPSPYLWVSQKFQTVIVTWTIVDICSSIIPHIHRKFITKPSIDKFEIAGCTKRILEAARKETNNGEK